MSRRETYTQAEYDLLSELHDYMFEDRKDIEKYVICVPKRYKVFFVLIFVVMSFNLTMLYIHSTITVKEIVIFMMMIVPSALGFWNSIAWKITVYTNRDYFTTRSFFLVKRIVHYSDNLIFKNFFTPTPQSLLCKILIFRCHHTNLLIIHIKRQKAERKKICADIILKKEK